MHFYADFTLELLSNFQVITTGIQHERLWSLR